MSKQERKAKGLGKKDPWLGLYDGLAAAAPMLLQQLHKHEGDTVELRLKHRGEGDWLALVKRIGPDGGPEIAFGTGYDALAALVGLGAAVARGGWRPDKPWTPGE